MVGPRSARSTAMERSARSTAMEGAGCRDWLNRDEQFERGGDGGPGSNDMRPWRVPALFVGAAVACIVTLALVALVAPRAPSSVLLPSSGGLQSHGAASLPISLAPSASSSSGASG